MHVHARVRVCVQVLPRVHVHMPTPGTRLVSVLQQYAMWTHVSSCQPPQQLVSV